VDIEQDAVARKARADRLRGKIEELKSGSEASGKPADEEKQPSVSETPREFVQRKMREIEKQGNQSN
jgi:hypothetical protein